MHGHFDDERHEYVITHPRTPRPWHNMLFNRTYLVNLTQHGTGSSFYQPAGEGLRANVTEDRDGNGGPRYVYLRDDDDGAYWSLTGAPDFTPMDTWACRVGRGYQMMESRLRDIGAAWRVLVPPGDDRVETWSITITNHSDRARRISVFPYLEMHLTGGSTLMDFIAVLGGHYDAARRAVFGINSCVKFPDYFKAFLALDSEVHGATVSRDAFLGPYRDEHNPIAVESGDVHNTEAGTEWLGASLRHRVELAPGASRTVHALIGVVARTDEADALIERHLAPGAPDAAFEALRERAEALRTRLVVQTPDAAFDRWVNVWMKHQLSFVGRWGRVIGRGYRDVLQDTFGHRLNEPALARDCLLEVFARQFPSGKCIRAWRLPHAQLDLQDYADSPSWMVMALTDYLKETGDLGVLDEDVPYLNTDDPYAPSNASASVWDHVVLAQRYLLAERGTHGLSKIYYGDWCDTMNGVGAAGRGESVMLTMQVKFGCDLLAELARHLHDPKLGAEMEQAAADLTQAIERTSWDGQWYLRAFDDEGVPVGSDNTAPGDNGEGRIFLNPQAWALIAGLGDAERRASAIAGVRRMLDTGYGVTLNHPPFTGLKPRIGQMTAMTPGFYENGSVYVHGNCFWIHGLAVAGQTDACLEAFRAVLPDTDNKPHADTEPFTIPNYYIGPAAPRRMQRNLYLSGWRTGSAAWLYRTAVEWILGARATYDGLCIAPQLPATWDHARIVRPYRGDTFEIAIRRGDTPGITVDGAPIEGDVVAASGENRHRTVEVVVAV